MFKRLKHLVMHITVLVLAAPACLPGASAAPLLVTNGAQLIGAKGVLLNQVSYDVSFTDGSCEGLFGGCAKFAFTSRAMADGATRALFNQVLLGPYDVTPSLVRGCTGSLTCLVYTPYHGEPGWLSISVGTNYPSVDDDRVTSLNSSSTDLDTTSGNHHYATWAVWTLSSSADTAIPEPGSAALVLLALAGLGLARRRRRSQDCEHCPRLDARTAEMRA